MWSACSRLSVTLILFASLRVSAEQASDYAIQVSAKISKSPQGITLTWPAPSGTTAQYRIFRKARTDRAFSGPIAVLPGTATSFTDASVGFGNAYEYSIDTNHGPGFGYICAGIEVPMIDERGKIILIADNSQAPAMAEELKTLQQDWVGDGWTVIRHDVGRNDSVTNVKALIATDYNIDPTNVKAVMLFGHVPVPYSGNLNPDGHDNHKGAWPADAYYGVMNGNWTDTSVNNSSARAREDGTQANANVPGDSKFDQSTFPGPVVLQVGRVDLRDLPQFAPLHEADLLRNYLVKDHKFRHGELKVERRGLICDNFGVHEGEAFAANGWRNFAPMFGAENIKVINGADQKSNADTWTATLQKDSYLWCYGTGPGGWFIANGVSKVDMFAKNDPLGVFYMLFGSFFGDWDSQQNYLRAPLASKTSGLACAWAGRPHWYFHHMVLGETIGNSAMLVQNNTGLYKQSRGANQVHIALMGDPTLRMHPVRPPGNLEATISGGTASLTWSASTDDSIVGYHVYRSSSPSGLSKRLTQSILNKLSYNDTVRPGTYTYMVRAVKLENTASGTYFNPSQGVFRTIEAAAPMGKAQ